ncbi:MAG: LLM class flavin-dependent oxidoreductase [Alphaproteobacteria bacterium]|nr:LLM class flavin-dependent oxidoreductase [Alphaproteobacteria bacterium]
MKFGSFHLLERPFTKGEHQIVYDHLEQIRQADETGFDSVWLTEHHFSSVPYVPDVLGEYGLSTSPYALACAVAMITKRVRIGTAIKILPLQHPLQTAEDIILADILSKGRIEAGFGTGYRKYEFDGFDIPINEKVERFKESVEIIVGAWTQEEFSYQGKFYKVPRLTLVPRPYQKPHPPIWVATRLGTREWIDYAVNNGYGLLSAWAPPHELRQTYNMFIDSRAAKGLAGKPFDFHCMRHIYVGETDKEAQAIGEEAVEYYMKSTAMFRPIGDHERSQMIFGSPETCIQKLRKLRDETGVNFLTCWMTFGGLPQDRILNSMRLFAKEVIPVLKADTARMQGRAAAE